MRHVILAALGTAFLASSSSISFACTCAGPSHEQSIRVAEMIFAIHVESEGRRANGHGLVYQVKVRASWRGDLPEHTELFSGLSNCNIQLKPGRDYLIYLLKGHSREMTVFLCSGSGLLEDLYYDRYLLGEPEVRYDDGFETITLESVLDRMRQPAGGEAARVAGQMRHFQAEAPLLLPDLQQIARGDGTGDQGAAVRAIGELGQPAASAFDDLSRVYDRQARSDAGLRSATMAAMVSVNPDYPELRTYLQESSLDPDPAVRVEVFRRIYSLEHTRGYELEVTRLAVRGFSDEDPQIRAMMIREARIYDHSPATAKRIRLMSRSDADDEVRYEAGNYIELRERSRRHGRAFRSVDDRGFKHPARRNH